MKTYGKAIIAALFFVWTVIAPLLTGDNAIRGWAEWSAIGLAICNALLVYIIPVNPKWAAGKTIINAVLAGFTAAQTVVGDGLQPDDWTIIIGAALAILIGWYAPAISMKGTTEERRISAGFNS